MHELITFDITDGKPKGLGALRYKTHPRIGEWVEVDVDEKGTMFEVVMVAHSSNGGSSDLYVTRLSDTPACIQRLCSHHKGSENDQY